MNPADDLEKRIKRLRVTTTDVLDQRILADAWAGLDDPRSTRLGTRRSSLWRIVMRNHWIKLAAVLLVVLATTLGTITFLGHTPPVAYALEQTLEANAGLRYIHVRIEPAGHGLSEAWVEFGDDGRMLRGRMVYPKTEDGAKEVVWQEDKAEVYFKTKRRVLVAREPQMAKRWAEMLAAFDPKAAMEQLHEAQARGKVAIETRAPSDEGDPVTLVVTFSDSPDKREIYRIDPQTKLVEQIERYASANGEWELVSRHQYLEYNQEIPPDKFVLDIPPGVTRIDWTTQEVGLAKGDLTDGQIAVKVAREFFEALIAEDFAKAGSLYAGIPASKMKEAFGKMEFRRIVSVGEPTPHPDPRTRFLQVPCEVELDMAGQVRIEKFTPLIRPVYSQPDRWAIGGGI